MAEDLPQGSKPAGSPHLLLNKMLGDWEGVTRTWYEPDILADESPTRGSIRPILGGLFVLYEYEGLLMNEPNQGMIIFGFDKDKGRFEAAWIDSAHMGSAIMFSTGKVTEKGFVVLGSYTDTGGGPPWGWRTEVAILEPDRLTFTAYNISPDGEEAKAVETVYHRKLTPA